MYQSNITGNVQLTVATLVNKTVGSIDAPLLSVHFGQ